MGNPTEGQRTMWVVGHVNWADHDLGLRIVETEDEARALVDEDVREHHDDDDEQFPDREHPDWHLSAIFYDGECMVFGGPFTVEPGEVE